MSVFRLAALDASMFTQVHRTFVEAFSDYAVNLSKLTEPLLRARAVKNGVDFSLSVAAFDDDDAMVGFTLVGVDTWQEELAAYDIATGIVARARGQSLAHEMFEFMRPRLRSRGVKRFVLEVLQQNAPAIRAYQKAGFAITRELRCFELDLHQHRRALVLPRDVEDEIDIGPAVRDVLAAFEDALDVAPSWEHSFSSLRRVPDGLDVYVAYARDRPAGLLAYYPGSQRIFTLVVKPAYRRRGVARQLVRHLLSELPPEIPSIRAIDVDASDTATIALLSDLGFGPLPAQYEMEARL